MSQENVERLRAMMEAFNRRDGTTFDRLLTSDAEVVPVRAALEGTIYRGPDAGTQYCTAVDQSWENLGWEVEEVRDEGEQILALGRIRGEGRDSGVAIDTRGGWLAQFSDGRVRRFQTFANRAEALHAAGLKE